MTGVELALASVLTLVGVRTMVRWLRVRFEAVATGDRLLFGVHVAARVGFWFALAGAFAGYALLDEPQRYRWFLFVPLALAALQLLTGLLLAREPTSRDGTD
ncbi:MAG TPA: hypothetical protein VNO34_02645 [Actinomycetota bacterium]|nr:hypothetical protein [Actinomycetota bacterium]